MWDTYRIQIGAQFLVCLLALIRQHANQRQTGASIDFQAEKRCGVVTEDFAFVPPAEHIVEHVRCLGNVADDVRIVAAKENAIHANRVDRAA